MFGGMMKMLGGMRKGLWKMLYEHPSLDMKVSC